MAHQHWNSANIPDLSGIAGLFNPVMGMPVAKGALSPLRAATDPSARSGDFFGPDGWMQMRGYPVPVARAQDTALARGLWDISVERTGVAFRNGALS